MLGGLSLLPTFPQFDGVLARVASTRRAILGAVVTLRHARPGSAKAVAATQQQLSLLADVDALLCALGPTDAADAL